METKLFNKIKKDRNIEDKTLKFYFDNVKRLNDRKPITTLNFLLDTDKIINQIQKFKLPTQRNYIASIIVLLNNKPKYEDVIEDYQFILKELNGEYNDHIESHKKTEKEEKNWCSMDALKDVIKFYKNLVKDFEGKKKLTFKEFETLQTYLILSFYILQPPRRLEDYANMKIITSRKDIKENNNYLLNLSRNIKYFIIGDYKTSKAYGQKEIKVPSSINTIMNTFLKYNNNEFLLINKKKEAMNANQLGKRVTKGIHDILDKKISVNMIRKIYISENVDLEAEKRRKKLAEDMGHSKNVQLTYIKK